MIRIIIRLILRETHLVSFDHYQHELHNQLQRASERGAKSIVVSAAELNLAVGGSSQFMESCFEALKAEIGPGDDVLVALDAGPGFSVRFTLPR